MKEKIAIVKEKFEKEKGACMSSKALDEVRVHFLGKKGPVQELMKALKDVPREEKPDAGKWINELKKFIESEIEQAMHALDQKETSIRLESETIDVTLPGRKKRVGSKHLITKVIDEMVDIFVEMGFSVQYAPEIDSEYYNFDVLNMPEDHSARDMQDTFYVDPETVLRTHATNLQGHVMERANPPFRMVCPGRVYRNESVSARSHAFFHQVDGFYVAENVTLQDLIQTLFCFCRHFFKKEVDIRVRPSYFPFVEPGIELDISCLLCEQKGCGICKHTGWLEILGAGMIHPQVLRNVGLDPERYSGFAWGMGVERQVLLRYGISDIRLFSENDMRFLTQFPSI